MTYIGANEPRRLVVKTEADCADPAYIVPIADITDPLNTVYYSDEKPLLELAMKVHDQIVRNSESVRAERRVCERLGILYDEYLGALTGRFNIVTTRNSNDDVIVRLMKQEKK